ncbi:MAG: hypothetical protein ACI8S6_000618 [Myxococcota bacterium]|jgi:hypothetical protein
MLLSLLMSCNLFAASPEPLALSVALPTAQHAGAVAARELLWSHRTANTHSSISDEEEEALCSWEQGEAGDDHIAEKLLERGALEFALVQADASGIWVGQEQVLALSGLIPADERRGQLITRLYDALLDRVESHKAHRSRCGLPSAPTDLLSAPVLLALSPSVSSETARMVMYTAGQAQLGLFYVAVDGPAGAPLPQGGCGLVVPRSDTPWADFTDTLDELSAAGAKRFIVAGSVEDPQPSPPAAPDDAPSALALTLQTTVPAFLVELPRISPPPDSGEDHPAATECSPKVYAMRADDIDFNAGLLGALSEGSGLDEAMLEGIGGLIGAEGTQIGTGGLGSRTTAAASLEVGTVTSEGPLHIEQARAVVLRHQNQLRYCYQRELNKTPGIAGTLTVEAVIGADGHTTSATITASTLSSDAVGQCIVGRLMRFQFPAMPAGQTATLVVPMTMGE